MKTGIELIAAERARQISVEGWTAEHDDNHSRQELALAAATYATPSPCRRIGPAAMMQAHCVPDTWPWSAQWWKPKHDDRVRELVKAGALIVAEIDRLQREDARKQPNH